jgi:predicted nucleic acid-binding protein
VISNVLMDAGPLVALVNPRDQWHDWARGQLDEIAPPMLCCESVLSEACFLARRTIGGVDRILAMMELGVFELGFELKEHFPQTAALIRQYVDVPMSLADACLVRMSELMADSVVFTLDADFHIYRRHRRQKIPLLIPDET